MEKSPAVAYVTYKIKNTDRLKLIEELQHAPLKDRDLQFMFDVIKGMSYKDLSIKYNKSLSRIAQWKRTVYEQLHTYDMLSR